MGIVSSTQRTATPRRRRAHTSASVNTYLTTKQLLEIGYLDGSLDKELLMAAPCTRHETWLRLLPEHIRAPRLRIICKQARIVTLRRVARSKCQVSVPSSSSPKS